MAIPKDRAVPDIAGIIEADNMSVGNKTLRPPFRSPVDEVDDLSIVLGMEANSWDAIERVALGLGVGPEAVRKWRLRGVPRSWRLDLLRADIRREINEPDFDNPPGPKRRETCRLPAEASTQPQ